jgi:hypothetical protein
VTYSAARHAAQILSSDESERCCESNNGGGREAHVDNVLVITSVVKKCLSERGLNEYIYESKCVCVCLSKSNNNSLPLFKDSETIIYIPLHALQQPYFPESWVHSAGPEAYSR